MCSQYATLNSQHRINLVPILKLGNCIPILGLWFVSNIVYSKYLGMCSFPTWYNPNIVITTFFPVKIIMVCTCMCNRPLISLTATVLRKSGEPTMQGAVLWTHHQYPAGKLPREILPTILLSWLMHCYGMHIDANFKINIIVVVNMYVKFFLPLQELGRCFRGIWRYWRRATDINLDTLKEVIKFWSTVENSYNRQVSLT